MDPAEDEDADDRREDADDRREDADDRREDEEDEVDDSSPKKKKKKRKKNKKTSKLLHEFMNSINNEMYQFVAFDDKDDDFSPPKSDEKSVKLSPSPPPSQAASQPSSQPSSQPPSQPHSPRPTSPSIPSHLSIFPCTSTGSFVSLDSKGSSLLSSISTSSIPFSTPSSTPPSTPPPTSSSSDSVPSLASQITASRLHAELKYFDFSNLVRFAYKTLGKKQMLHCKLIRNKESNPEYQLFLEGDNRFLMAAKDMGMDGYLLTAAPYDMSKEGENYLGKIKKPFGKRSYILYSRGKNPRKTFKWSTKATGDIWKTFDPSFREEMLLLEFDKDKSDLNMLTLHLPLIDPATGVRRAIHPVHQNTGIEFLHALDTNPTLSLSSSASSSTFQPLLQSYSPSPSSATSSSSSSSFTSGLPGTGTGAGAVGSPLATRSNPSSGSTNTNTTVMLNNNNNPNNNSNTNHSLQRSQSMSEAVFVHSSSPSSSSFPSFLNAAVAGSAGGINNLLRFTNRKAVLNPKTNMYLLNFHKRAKTPSVKNIQLIPGTNREANETDVPTVLMFGKMDETLFSLDFIYPFCPLQAFAIAIGIFDNN